jgi:hypothetical protein
MSTESKTHILSSVNSSNISLTETNLKININNDDIDEDVINKDNVKEVIIKYHGIDIVDAARTGNLPVFLLLWGKAALYKKNLLSNNDEFGNTLMHHAATAVNTEVFIYNILINLILILYYFYLNMYLLLYL